VNVRTPGEGGAKARSYNLVVTNVPGPPVELHLLVAPVKLSVVRGRATADRRSR
jgi:hypothetical protein